MANLLLWDLDGTLLTAASASRAAMYAAIAEVLGAEVEDCNVKAAGKTDPVIAREILVASGVSEDDLDRTVRLTLRKFGPQLAARRREIATLGKVFPGVRELLGELDKTRALSTVLTGNIAVNAICKLDAFRLTSHFDLEVGAFGSDDSVRNNLVDVAINRVAEKRNKYFNDEQIWIIGDTPFDLAAARAHEINCLLVSTGQFTFEELEVFRPDVLVRDLTDIETLLPLLLGN